MIDEETKSIYSKPTNLGVNHHYNSNPKLRRRMVRELGLGFNAPFSSHDGPLRQPSFPRPLSAADSLEQSSDQHFTALEREPRRRRWRGAPFGVRGSSALRSGSLKRQTGAASVTSYGDESGRTALPSQLTRLLTRMRKDTKFLAFTFGEAL